MFFFHKYLLDQCQTAIEDCPARYSYLLTIYLKAIAISVHIRVYIPVLGVAMEFTLVVPA